MQLEELVGQQWQPMMNVHNNNLNKTSLVKRAVLFVAASVLWRKKQLAVL